MNKSGMVGYIAGFFDAEGNIFISKWIRKNARIHYSGGLTITNTNKEILKNIMRFLGFGSLLKCDTDTNNRWKIRYRLRFYQGDSVRLIKIILPHLYLKKQRAKLLLKFVECDYDKKAFIFNKMKQLNVRGPVIANE